jgi:glycosyltransferase involved in cell wall biosynthesis
MELASYYRGAEALVFPTLYEGFGLPVLEAMACGTPVITSNCTALPEVAGKACLLVDPEQTEEIATAIRRVANDSAIRKEMRVSGIERSKHFTWERTAAKVRSALEEASGSSGHG